MYDIESANECTNILPLHLLWPHLKLCLWYRIYKWIYKHPCNLINNKRKTSHIKYHQLLDTQFETYTNDVKKTDCQATLRRLLKRGPPIYVSDKHAFPLAKEDDTHVCKLWFALDGKERSAKLKGAVEGEERDVLWLELKEFIIEEGKEEGDEDDDGDEEDKKWWCYWWYLLGEVLTLETVQSMTG